MPDIFIATPKNKKKQPMSLNLLASFIQKPSQIHFNGQHNSETIVLLLRRHWITNLGWLFMGFILLITPVFIFSIIDINNFMMTTIPIGFILAVILFWYLGCFGFILLNFLFWFYNVGIITNERIIDADFIHLLYSEITETIISRVEDVTNKRGGFSGIFFDYGNVFVQTAGTDANIEFMGIPKPSFVVEIISKLQEQANR